MADWSEHMAMLPSKCSALTNALSDRRYETALKRAAEIEAHAKALREYVEAIINPPAPPEPLPLVKLGPE